MKTSCATSSRSVIPFIQRRTVAEVFIGAGFFAGVAAKAETASRHTVRSLEKNPGKAKAPAPQEPKPLRTKVGQTLSSVNPAISAIDSQLLSTGHKQDRGTFSSVPD
jgi:hypothetical protein